MENPKCVTATGKEVRLYRTVLNRLLQMLNAGDYPVGGRLPPERELAERFGVSRPTIREVMIALETLDRVQIKPGSGVYVTAPTPTDPAIDTSISAYELTEARAMIEGETAALAATVITDEGMAELETTLNQMADETVGGQLRSEEADKQFHFLISRATGNRMLTAVFDNLWRIRDHSPRVSAAYRSICETDVHVRYYEHKEIFDALNAKAPDAARSAMHRHFSRILNKLIEVDEAMQLDNIRRQTEKSRERFSLHHLISRV